MLEKFFKKDNKNKEMAAVDTTDDLTRYGLKIEESTRPLRVFQGPDREVLIRRGARIKTVPGKQRIIG